MISQQSIESKRYKNETENSAYFYEVIPSVMKRLLYSCNTDNNFVHTDLVTLNILTKYFITIRYNLNKILLS